MASISLTGVRIAGIASAIPEGVRRWQDDAVLFGTEEMEKTSKAIGVRRRHVAPPQICTSDLCHAAATQLLDALGWDRATVNGVILVTQSPDYELPATACTLQSRLGLPDSCIAFDVNLGCSGFTYGLWLGAQIVAGKGVRRLLLLAGDICTRRLAPRDKSVIPLFGDAGTATAIEYDEGAGTTFFELGTDGTGYRSIIIPASGFRIPRSTETKQLAPGSDGIERSLENIHLNGPEVFNFTLKRVPPLIESLMRQAGLERGDYDHFVFHQANAFMLQHLAKRLKLPPEKFVIAMDDVGNTSSASIPLAMTLALRPSLVGHARKMLLAGFGVGLSWAAASLDVGPIVMPELIVLPDATLSQAVG
jgi:3-oxoacyl-[acyl-carrier-protein] synthase III